MNLFEQARTQSSLSGDAMASMLGVTYAYVYSMITSPGKMKDPTLLLKLSDILGIKEADAIAEWRRLRRKFIQASADRRIREEGLDE